MSMAKKKVELQGLVISKVNGLHEETLWVITNLNYTVTLEYLVLNL